MTDSISTSSSIHLMSMLRCCRRITKLEALLRADEGDFLARLGRLPDRRLTTTMTASVGIGLLYT